jgi:hypothetical protein
MNFYHYLLEYYGKEEKRLKNSQDELVTICEALQVSYSLKTFIDKMNLPSFNSFKHLYSKLNELKTFSLLIERLNESYSLKNNSLINEVQTYSGKKIDLTNKLAVILAIIQEIVQQTFNINKIHKVKF